VRIALNDAAVDTLFRTARSHNAWLNKPVTRDELKAAYDVAKWGPTSANSFPLRVVFVCSADAKARLVPLVAEGNREKVKSAPVIAIFAYDTRFYDWLPRLLPHKDMRPVFAENQTLSEVTAFRNGTLQAAYFMIAARAMGLDCGPMSGFDNAKVDEAFFATGQLKSNFICALGHGDPAGLYARSPRPDFDEVCRIE
jgi:3-hydroxypropanoate dehydrogenase